MTNTFSCSPELTYGEQCSAGQCRSETTCDGGTCKLTYGQTCDTNQDKCRSQAVCEGSTCKLNYGESCTDNPDNCRSETVCDGAASKCKVDFNQACNVNSDHCKTGTTCDSSLRKCRRNYGSTCTLSQSNECLSLYPCSDPGDGNAHCLCPENLYRDGNTCKNVNTLKVARNTIQKPAGTAYETTSITATWSKPQTGLQVDYRASLDDGNMTAWSTDLIASFDNRTPGTRYYLTVWTRRIQDPSYGTQTVSVTSESVAFYTKPAIPGELVEKVYIGTSGTPGRDVTIQFYGSAGRVASYTVTIKPQGTGGPGTTVTVTEIADVVSAPFQNLTPDGNYDVTITASSWPVTGPSDTRTDTFYVEATPAGEVSNLNLPEKDSRWIRATWRKPGDPNGVIKGYTVRVNRQGTSQCVVGVSITCSDCTYNETRQRPNTSDCNQELGAITKTLYQLADTSYLLDVNVTDLLPDVRYDVHVVAFNHKGPGMDTQQSETTNEEAALNLELLTADSSTLNELNVSWTPGLRTGQTSYNVTWEEETRIGSNQYTFINSIVLSDYNTRQYTITGLLSYWRYQVTVFAFTRLGSSPIPTVKQFRTLDYQPGQLKAFIIQQPGDSAKHLDLTVTCPEERQRNGPITAIGYNSTVVNTGDAGPAGSKNTDCSGSVVIKAGSFVAETDYQINVFAITRNYHGEISTDTVTLQARAPSLNSRPPESQKIVEKPATDASTETSVTVNLCTCLVDNDQGQITSACLIVCRKSDTEDCKPEPPASDNQKCSGLPTWKMFKQNSYTGRYRPTPDDWHKSSLFRDASRRRRSAPHRDRRATTEVKQYTIGNDTNCGDADASVYCDGPLKPDSEYVIIPVACTSGGCAEYDQPSVIRTKGPDKARVEVLHRNSNLHFLTEYQELLDSRTGHFTTDVGKLEINMMKNRYPAILPYDHTRVKLFTRGHQNQDYINASYISTTVDRYWPTQMDSPSQYGEVTIKMTSRSVLPSHTVRKITARMIGEEKQEVTQFELTGWRGHKCTLALEDVADMVQTVGDVTRSCTGPVTVHCSDGTARTASFIALDMLNRFVEEHELSAEVNVFRVLYNMMKCRPHLIQSEDQYIFIHDVLSVIISRKMQDGRGKGKVYQNLGYTDNVYDSTDMYSTIPDTNPYEKLTPQGKATSSL
ncbi:hypothetical protein BaRGS_00037817 [Batillaria attramentaria]|uniref:Protein-tyrosine-phosphatase n=1 Tax=Batillaria attramentaria TaxID=370345 RepID=A0ABD0J8X3_9CAEN